jgi:type I restriction enzyme S subunit
MFTSSFPSSPSVKIPCGYWPRSGSAQPFIKPSDIGKAWVTFPKNVEQQRKIAAILGIVDGAIEQKEALTAKYQRIKTGLMQDLLTRGIDEHGSLRDPATHKFKPSPLGPIPEEWDAKALRDISTQMTNGFVGVATPFYTENPDGILYLYGTNIRRDEIILTDVRKVTPEFHKAHKKSKLRFGDMLTVQSGHIGTCATVPDGFSEANCHALIITRFKKGIINPSFVSAYCNSETGMARMAGIFIGSTIKHINVADLLNFTIPVPEPKEQTTICELMASASQVIERKFLFLAKMKKLKTGLMQDLLTGKVPVEPLLETQNESLV